MDMRERLELAGQVLLDILDREKDLMPTGGYEVAHDLGRWWDAILRIEETIGFVIPAELEAASLRNLHLLADNPDRLMMNRADVSWLADGAVINPHNFRETLLAYGGLFRRRRNLWARQAALELIDAMDRTIQADGSLDLTRLGSWGRTPGPTDPAMALGPQQDGGWFDMTGSTGRALEALVWMYELTGESPILATARRIAEHHLAYTVNLDGSMREEIVDPANPGHCHSYHGTLRGMLLFGLLTGESKYVEVVENTYRNAVRNRMVKESGWAPHDLGLNRFPNNLGDPSADEACPGDSAQLALWLALRAGCHDLLDDVERLVRCRMFPSQKTEEDAKRYPDQAIDQHSVGAWTNHGPSHAGKKRCLIDVHAAVVHSLCDIYQNICTSTPDGLMVNLHLDYEDDRLKIVSKRRDIAEVTICAAQPCNMMIRVPGWTPEESVSIAVAGKDVPFERDGMFARVTGDAIGGAGTVVMSYALPKRGTQETMASGRVYSFDWRGDEIVAIDPQDEGDGIPLYAGRME